MKKRPDKPAVWTTKDGRVLLIKDMADSHLINAYCYAVRAAQNIAACLSYSALAYSADAPDHAADAADHASQELDALAEYPDLVGIGEMLGGNAGAEPDPSCSHMYDELEKRGLLEAAHKKLGFEVEDSRVKTTCLRQEGANDNGNDIEF